MSPLQQPSISKGPVPVVLSSRKKQGRSQHGNLGRSRKAKAGTPGNKQRVRVYGSISKSDGTTEEIELTAPCNAPPGSEEKIQVLQQRYAAGLPFHVNGDASMDAWHKTPSIWRPLFTNAPNYQVADISEQDLNEFDIEDKE